MNFIRGYTPMDCKCHGMYPTSTVHVCVFLFLFLGNRTCLYLPMILNFMPNIVNISIYMQYYSNLWPCGCNNEQLLMVPWALAHMLSMRRCESMWQGEGAYHCNFRRCGFKKSSLSTSSSLKSCTNYVEANYINFVSPFQYLLGQILV